MWTDSGTGHTFGFATEVRRALKQLSDTSQTEGFGVLEHLVIDMILRGVSWGMFSEFSNAVIIQLRDKGSCPGDQQQGLHLECYVFDQEESQISNKPITFSKCFLYAIQQAKLADSAEDGSEHCMPLVLNHEHRTSTCGTWKAGGNARRCAYSFRGIPYWSVYNRFTTVLPRQLHA